MPGYQELRELLSESQPNDWIKQSAQWATANTTDRETMWLYRDDVELQLVPGRTHVTGFKEPWTEPYPDNEHNKSFSMWLSYSGSPVEEYIVVSVDGGRATVPLPSGVSDDAAEISLHRDQNALAQIVNDGAVVSRNAIGPDINVLDSLQ